MIGLVAAGMAATPAEADELQAILQRYLTQEGIPGGVVLVSSPERREVVAAGLADLAAKTAVTTGSRFYVASVGKIATAVAVLQQVEEGLLSLDAKASTLVHNVPDVGRLANFRESRLENLLDHSSGIPDYLTDAFVKTFHAKPTRLTPATVLPYAIALRATGRPGATFEYSNTNYVLLGDVVATADRGKFEESLRRRVLVRAGMPDTTVGADPKDPCLAHGYADLDDSGTVKDVSRYAWNSPLGDGALVTTAADLERFLFALFRDGKLLRPSTVARMTAPSANEETYGLGVELGNDRWGDWWGHTGSEDGFEAEVRYYPKRRAALVAMVNGNSVSADSVLDEAAALLFDAGSTSKKK